MKANYHTHTTFCDGKCNPQEMVIDAINCGFDILGFSSHATFPFYSDWSLQLEKYDEYCTTINALKNQYKDKIEIFLGFEADFVPMVTSPSKSRYERFNPDFIIGAVHYIINLDNAEAEGFSKKDCNIPLSCFTIDGSENEVKTGIEKMFCGNGKLVAQTYFELAREMIRSNDFDIIAHPDLLRKRNSSLRFFNENDEWYKGEITETAKTIAKSGKVVEINYGGISRHSLNDTYPSLEFLKLLNKADVPITISSDAHSTGQFNNGYDYALKQAKTAGYNEIHYLTGGLWKTFKI